MDISTYQRHAASTDQKPLTAMNDDGVVVPLLGLAGEVGSLQAAYKKKLRDGDDYRLFGIDVAEELGDIMWYVANLANKFDLDLSQILTTNLSKVQSRWPSVEAAPRLDSDLYDSSAASEFRLPRTFSVEFRPVANAASQRDDRVQGFWNGEHWGSELGDNAYMEDGYRFHDVFHLAHAAVLGWSPVARSLFHKKRKFDPALDDVEDGGRAIVIEEGIVAYVYGHATRAGFFEKVASIDWSTLKTIRHMTDGLEVASRQDWEWERAILQAYGVWRALRAAKSGIVVGDLYTRTVRFEHAP